MKKLSIFLIALSASATANAQQVYTDRAAFTSALGSHVFMDFENLVGSPAYPQNYPTGPGYYTTNGGITIGDLNFSGGGAGTFLLHGTTENGIYSLNGSWNLLASSTAAFRFAAGTTALGFDFGLGSRSNRPITISVRPVGGQLSQVAMLAGGAGSTFFGYTGPAFDQLSISSNTSEYVFVDNVAYGSLATLGAVPEPATWAIMILGFGVIGSALRRRRALRVRFAS